VPEHVEPAPQPPPKAAAAAAISSSAQQKVEAQARAVSEAAAALKRDQQELANAQRQFAAKIEAAEAQLAAAQQTKSWNCRRSLLRLRSQRPPLLRQPTLRPRAHGAAEYPYEAQRSGTEGWVNVSSLGHARRQRHRPASRTKQQRHAVQSRSAHAVRKWSYEPFASADPLATQRLMVRVEFRMQARD
jgi:protein TonB